MKSRLFKVFVTIVVGLILLASLAVVYLLQDLPDIDQLPSRLNQPSVRILDRSGKLLYEDISEIGGRHLLIPLDQVPEYCQEAVIATEDRSFFTNPGFDLRGVIRSAWYNLRGERIIAGGSTITQQVVRNLLMENQERSQRTVLRKMREIVLAWQLTRLRGKEDILALYLNQTYFGGMAYGIEAASQTFFGKPARELDLAECALLAGLPQAPALYNPYTDPDAAKSRQFVVLSLMEKAGIITHGQRSTAEQEPLVYSSSPYPMQAPHFVLMVRNQVDQLFTQEEIYQAGGLSVRTTLNLDWQLLAEAAVQRQIEALRQSPDGLGHNVHSASLVAIDPGTGEVLALVGSPDFFDADYGGAVNMAVSPRQPGSALKPFIYASALDPAQAFPWSAGTMILDTRTAFQTHDNKPYIPENYDRMEHGPVLVRQALASSLNIPAVIAMDHIGLERFFSFALSMGISTLHNPHEYDLSIALGGGAVRLIELTAAYGSFANGGVGVDPFFIQEIRNSQDEVVLTNPEHSKPRVMDARLAWLITDILSDDSARILGFGSDSVLNLGFPAAVKTGTTTNFHDNWTVGYTPRLVVGVWAGNTNYEPMREVTGLTGAAPIWAQFMRAVVDEKTSPAFTRPDGLTQIEICRLTGLLPSHICPSRQFEWFIDGTQPTGSDHLLHEVILDIRSNQPAEENTPQEYRIRRLAMDLPISAQAWAHSQGLFLWSDLVTKSNTNANTLMLISPAAGAIYHLASGFPDNAQQILLEAAYPSNTTSIRFWIDGNEVARIDSPPYRAWWTITKGTHQVWVSIELLDGTIYSSEPISIEVK